MSTKTLRKRIALIAITTLGAGVLSVAPASATTLAYTTVLGTVTPADGSAAVGSVVTIPLLLSTGAAADVVTSSVHTATFAQLPINSALTSAASIAAGVTSFVAITNWTSTAATNALTVSGVNTSRQLASDPVGEFKFTPDVPGVYQVTIAGAATTAASNTNTATTAITIIVKGASLNQATSGKGKATGTATTGGSAVVQYVMPGATAAGARFNITSTGVGSVSNPQDCALDSAVLIAGATAVRCTTGGSTTEGFINGVNGSEGVFFENTTLSAGNVLIGPSAQTVVTFDAGSNVAGVQTITITSIAVSTGVPTTAATVTITWGANATPSAQYSKLTLNTGAGTTATGSAADTDQTSAARTAGTKQFTVQVVVNGSDNAIFNVSTVGASLTGPGTIGIAAGNAGAASAGRSLTVATTDGTASVAIYGDGTAGTTVVTITSTNASGVSTTLGTKTVTFAGSASTATVTQNLFVAKAGTQLGLTPATTRVNATANSIATTPALRAAVVDSNGNAVVAGSTVRIVSSDETVITAGACAEYSVDGDPDTAAAQPTPGIFECTVSGAVGAASGKSATITFQVLNTTTSLYSIVATPITFKIGGSIASVALATDKTSYAPGEAMTMTATAKDSAGNAAFDGQAPYASISSNLTITGAPSASVIIRNGVHTTNTSTGVQTMFAPSTSGNLVVSGLTTDGKTGTAYSVALTIEADAAVSAAADAANEATDAANAATDAALAAADAADAATAAAQDASDAVAALSATVAKLVASLKAQITSLTNLVIKIQKKVKA